MRTDRLATVLAFAVLCLVGAKLDAGVTGSDEGTWAIEGIVSDACQCSVYCSCELNDKPTMGHCDDAAILHIRKGHYGKVKRDGLRVTVVTPSPQGERVVDAVGHLNFAHIYVPKEATTRPSPLRKRGRSCPLSVVGVREPDADQLLRPKHAGRGNVMAFAREHLSGILRRDPSGKLVGARVLISGPR